jgi:hypothetical protein
MICFTTGRENARGIIDDDGRAGRRCAPGSGAAAPPAENAVMLTVFLKHDRSRPLSEFDAQLQRQGYYKAFLPEGGEVVS